MTNELTKTTEAETEANRQTMTETFEAWRDGAEPFPDTWATDMVWRIEGRSIASREYASKQEYLEQFVKPFGARFLASERLRHTALRGGGDACGSPGLGSSGMRLSTNE